MRLCLATLVLLLAAAPVATAGNPKHGHKRHHRHGHHQPTPPIVIPPVTPPVVTPPIVTPAPTPPQVDAVSFCVSTTSGITYVQLTAGAMDPGQPWRLAYDGGATALVAGHIIMFVPKGDAGISLAKIVPGVGSTC